MSILVDIEFKECKTCHKLLPLTEYHKEPRAKDKLFYSCKDCYKIYRKKHRENNPLSDEKKKEHNEKNKIWYNNNKDKKTEYVKLRRKNYPHIQRNIDYKNKYNITINEYDDMLQKQNRACAICKISQSELNYRLMVDHSHDTNKIRGLLCRNCNLAIGYFKDNIKNIENSIHYLENFKKDDNS